MFRQSQILCKVIINKSIISSYILKIYTKKSNMNTQTQNKFCNDINFFEHIILKPFNQRQIQNYFQFIKSQNVNNNQLYYSMSYLDNLENKKHLIIMFLIRQYCIQLHRVKMMLPKIVKYRNLFQHISHKINICLYSFNASILKSLNLTYVIKIIYDYKFQTHLLEELQNQIISQNINADIFIKFQNYNFKFNTKLIFETQHLKYIIKKCQENKNLQTTLLNILYQSKTQSEIKIAAANALTILNISGYKFIGRDLSNIQVPGATLSKGIFNNCIFKNANFQTCNFQQASFKDCIFDNANLNNIKFGESADLRGHDDYVQTVRYTQQKIKNKIVDCLYSASLDNTVKLWDIHKAECLKTIKIKHIGLNQIIFSNDCLLFCTSSMNGTIKIWDTLTGTCQSSIIQAHNQPITAICFSHDNQCICSAAEDKLIKIWDITTRTCTDTFTGHLQSVTALYFSKDNILYSGSHDQTIKQWGKNSKSCIQTYYGHHDCISSIFECNNYIYSASWDKTIKIWRKDQDKSLQTLYGHSDIIQHCVYHKMGNIYVQGHKTRLQNCGKLISIIIAGNVKTRIWGIYQELHVFKSSLSITLSITYMYLKQYQDQEIITQKFGKYIKEKYNSTNSIIMIMTLLHQQNSLMTDNMCVQHRLMEYQSCGMFNLVNLRQLLILIQIVQLLYVFLLTVNIFVLEQINQQMFGRPKLENVSMYFKKLVEESIQYVFHKMDNLYVLDLIILQNYGQSKMDNVRISLFKITIFRLNKCVFHNRIFYMLQQIT
ncbi:Pentapeptide_repeats-containing protein [Hexamita inflata]|uniref:Pentapeptide_repeats-containing protein n=1 Tax=Hexamita inflata TaxID=28002 RepID=A0ABP1IBJ0_9EUKA